MWSLQNIAEQYGASAKTVKRHIEAFNKKAEKKKKFKKTAPGHYFNYQDVQTLADILKFPFNENIFYSTNGNGNGKK